MLPYFTPNEESWWFLEPMEKGWGKQLFPWAAFGNHTAKNKLLEAATKGHTDAGETDHYSQSYQQDQLRRRQLAEKASVLGEQGRAGVPSLT